MHFISRSWIDCQEGGRYLSIPLRPRFPLEAFIAAAASGQARSSCWRARMKHYRLWLVPGYSAMANLDSWIEDRKQEYLNI